MTVDFVKLEKDMLSLLGQIGDVFSASERKDVVDFIDHGEYGLALETLSDIFVEGHKNLTRACLLEIENLADVMGIRKRVVTEALVKQVIGEGLLMENRVSDYTVGFEGESEIHFILNSQAFSWIIKLWEGYFSAIMEPIEPGPNGWTGLALPYHTLRGWDKDEKWQIPNLTEVINQLSSIEPKRFQDPSHKILLEIRELLSLASKNNQPVFIRRG